MSRRLGAAARDLRLARGLRMIDIATRAGVREPTIHRFERGDGWRRDTDRIVHAYAHELGVQPEDIWRAALARAE